MSEAKTDLQDDEGPPIYWASFCGELGIYHLHHEVEGQEPQDSKLTRDELQCLVEGMIAAGKAAEAQQIASMCAYARLFMHKIVTFDATGHFKVYNPVPPPDYELVDNEDMKSYQEIWKKEHLMGENVPVVAAYPSQKNLPSSDTDK